MCQLRRSPASTWVWVSQDKVFSCLSLWGRRGKRLFSRWLWQLPRHLARWVYGIVVKLKKDYCSGGGRPTLSLLSPAFLFCFHTCTIPFCHVFSLAFPIEHAVTGGWNLAPSCGFRWFTPVLEPPTASLCCGCVIGDVWPSTWMEKIPI